LIEEYEKATNRNDKQVIKAFLEILKKDLYRSMVRTDYKFEIVQLYAILNQYDF